MLGIYVFKELVCEFIVVWREDLFGLFKWVSRCVFEIQSMLVGIWREGRCANEWLD